MLKQKEHFHGSDLEKIEAVYGVKKEDIISFSANVNPLGISPLLRKGLAEEIDVLTRYPDREYTGLRKSIAAYINTSHEHILVGNGSTELIGLFIQLTAPKRAMLLAPTYSEYEREIRMDHGSVDYFTLSADDDFVLNTDALLSAITEQTDLLVICNPNNPTSSVIYHADMERILTRCLETNTFVMVDETYIEFAPEYAEIESISLTEKYKNLVVLRGVSKFFASPGLRLGYAVCGDSELLKSAAALQNPWSVSSIAEVAGRIMFGDKEYISRTKDLIQSEQRRIYELLRKETCLKVFPPHGNFILCRILNDVTANDLFEAAIVKNMMIRNCDTFTSLDEHYFRFCFMNPEDNDRLLACILPVLRG